MAVANVVAKFEADISDVQAKMAALKKSFSEAGDSSRQLSDRFKTAGDAMSRVGKGMTIGITLPLAAIGAAAVKASVDFESSMSKIVGLVGIASDEVAGMQEQVLSLAGETAKAPVELANGLFVVTSAGLRGETAMEALEMAARAGAAGLGETNDIARAVSGALSAYGSDVLSAADATDAIVATARAGNFETSQFAGAIGRVLPFAKQAGATFEDMGGAVALLTRVNGDAAQSVTQMSALFRAFVVPSEEAKKSLDAVGLSAGDLRDSIAEQGLPATLQMLDDALGGNREQLGRILGSSEAASAAFQILDADAKTIADTFGVVADASGMTDEAFDAAADTAGFKMQQAMVSLQSSLIQIGDIIVPLVTDIAKFTKTLLDGFQSLPGPVKTAAVALGGVFAAMGPILWIGGKIIKMLGIFGGAWTLMKGKAVAGITFTRGAVKTLELDIKSAMIKSQTHMGAVGAAAKVMGLKIAAGLRGAAVAVRGFIAAFGPIGLAITGVTLLMDGFLGKNAAIEASVESLREEVDLTTRSLTAAGEKLVAEQLFDIISPEDQQALQNYGISMEEILAAVLAGGPAMEAMVGRLNEFRNVEINPFGRFGADTIRQNILTVSEGVQQSYAAAEAAANAGTAANLRNADAARRMAGEHRAAAAQARAAAQGVMTDGERMTQVTETTADAVRALKDAFSELNSITSDVRAADAAHDALVALQAQVQTNTAGFDGYSDAQRANRDALLDYVDAQVAFAQSLKDPQAQLEALQTLESEVKASLKAGGVKPKDSAVYQSIKGAVDEAEVAVQEMETAVADAESKGLDVAGAIATGIEQGMSLAESGINAAGMSGGEAIIDGMNAGAGIASPSKYAIDAGRMVGVGAIQGLNEMRNAANGAAMNIGANIVRGMITAMNNGRGPVAAAARALVAAAIAAARAESQEGSPSRVFMGIGNNMVLGLEFGVRSGVSRAENTMSRAARAFTRAFRAEFFPKEMGAAESAVANAIANAEADLADARERLKEANRAGRDAEKALEQARKDGNPKEIAKAERELVKARREATAAADAVKLAEWVQANEAALQALQKIAAQYDYIVGKMEVVQNAASNIASLLERPLGTESNLSQMFQFGTDPGALARNYMQLAGSIREAFSVLTDPKIVGRGAARANRRLMNQTIRELEGYVTQIIALQAEYEANAEQMRLNEEAWRENERQLSATIAEATKNYDEAISRQNSIKQGFRSFINDISRLTDGVVTAVKQQTTELANGVKLIVESADTTSAAGAIAANMQARLAEVREFSTNIKTLMERGLDPALIRDFVEAGVANAGSTVATLAAAADDELRAINETQAELAKHAAEFAEEYVPTADLKAAVDAAQKALDDALAAYTAERARLEAEQERIEADIAVLVTQIEALVTNMMATLIPATEAAAQASVDAMIAQFEKDFPRVAQELGALMDSLARSLQRTVRINVELDTSGATGAGGSTRRSGSFTPNTVVVQTPPSGRSVTVSPNAVSVNVTAGAGVDSAALTAQVRIVVDESLQELAREIVSA